MHYDLDVYKDFNKDLGINSILACSNIMEKIDLKTTRFCVELPYSCFFVA